MEKEVKIVYVGHSNCIKNNEENVLRKKQSGFVENTRTDFDLFIKMIKVINEHKTVVNVIT